MQHRRPVVLDHGDLVARRRSSDLVHLPRRVQRHEPSGVHLGGRIRDPVLHGLLVREQRSVGEAAERALAHHVKGALGLTKPTHAVVDATRSETGLGEQEARALRANQVVRGDVHVLVENLGVVTEATVGHFGIVHRTHVAKDRDTLGVHGHHEH